MMDTGSPASTEIMPPIRMVIASAAAMVETEQCVEDIRQIVFPHPTQSEALKETVLHA